MKRFVIIGAGWRAMYYVRAAARQSGSCYEPVIYCRNPEKAAELRDKRGLICFSDFQECLSTRPDFLVLAVPKEVSFEWIVQLEDIGLPILCETPPALTRDELHRIWQDNCSGRLQMMVAEQYLLTPSLAAIYEAVNSRKIGDPYYLRISRAHGYHGISLIRHFLHVRGKTAAIQGQQWQEPVLVTGHRPGIIRDGDVRSESRDFVTFAFENGKRADYDFDSVLYHSSIRRYHLLLQGERGEICDQHMVYAMNDRGKETFAGETIGPDTFYQNRFGVEGDPDRQDYEEDDIAILRLMDSMDSVREGRDGAYRLADALQDTYLWLLMQEAVAGGKCIRSVPQPWQSALTD